MKRISLWYRGLGRSSKTLVIVACVVLAVAIAGAIGYMVLNPKKVEVKYGTIVRDPVDGHVWEDKTKTAWVNPSQADNYRVEYVDKLSPEHEQQAAEKAAEQEAQQQQQQAPSLNQLQAPISSQTLTDLNTLQQNIETMGSSVVSGMEMAGKISATKASLVDYRNQVASLQLPPELQGMQQQVLQAFDMYIQACDLYLQGIATSDMAVIQQANNLINEANNIVRGMIPTG